MADIIKKAAFFPKRRFFPRTNRFLKSVKTKPHGIEIPHFYVRGNVHTIFDGQFDEKPTTSLWIRRAKNYLLGIAPAEEYKPLGFLSRFMQRVRSVFWSGPSTYQKEIMNDVINFLLIEAEG